MMSSPATSHSRNAHGRYGRLAPRRPQPAATTRGSMASTSTAARATSRSYRACRFNQDSRVMPRDRPRRNAMPAVMARRPWTISFDAARLHTDGVRQVVLAHAQFVEDFAKCSPGWIGPTLAIVTPASLVQIARWDLSSLLFLGGWPLRTIGTGRGRRRSRRRRRQWCLTRPRQTNPVLGVGTIKPHGRTRLLPYVPTPPRFSRSACR